MSGAPARPVEPTPKSSPGPFPGTRKITHWLGDDEAGVDSQLVEGIQLRIQLPQLGDVARVIERADAPLTRVTEDPERLPITGGHGHVNGILDPAVPADVFDEADRAG